MDIIGLLPRTKHGNRFLLVIADQFSKVTKTIPLRTVTALSVVRAFCDHWAYVYGPPCVLAHRQWSVVHCQVLSGILRGTRNQKSLHDCVSSPNERAGRAIQPYYLSFPPGVRRTKAGRLGRLYVGRNVRLQLQSPLFLRHVAFRAGSQPTAPHAIPTSDPQAGRIATSHGEVAVLQKVEDGTAESHRDPAQGASSV
jgi:hypothetical protein